MRVRKSIEDHRTLIIPRVTRPYATPLGNHVTASLLYSSGSLNFETLEALSVIHNAQSTGVDLCQPLLNDYGDVRSLSVDGSVGSCKSTAIVPSSFSALMLTLIYASL
jgi:hypothetical protein